MANSYFQFRQFTIWQDHCAMKVGTDGVLLGAWARCPSHTPSYIADIGTGTGLVALMLAQRYAQAQIDAVEIEPHAAAQAQANVAASPWAQRVRVWQADVLQWQPPVPGYDLVVSNPPFFAQALPAATQARSLARHDNGLSIMQLFGKVVGMLRPDGCLALVLPTDQLVRAHQAAAVVGLHAHQMCYVHTTPQKAAKRVLALWGFAQQLAEEERLVIELHRHQYSEAFRNLTDAFYLPR